MNIKLDKNTLKYAELYLKYKSDIVKFAEECVNIPTPGGDELIKLYEPQKKVLRSFLEDHHLVLLKSRQTGFSTISQVISVWISVFYENCVMGIISRDGAESSDFVRKTQNMIDKLPKWLRPSYEHKSIRSSIFDNGCELHASAVSPHNPGAVFRGKAIVLLIVDEASHITHLSEAWTSVAPALSKAQDVAKKKDIPYGTIVLSTPNRTEGRGKFFYHMWLQALENTSFIKKNIVEDEGSQDGKAGQYDAESDAKYEAGQYKAIQHANYNAGQYTESRSKGTGLFVAHKIYWKEIPEFRNDPEWYKKQCDILHNDPRKIAQELELKFVGSEHTLFPEDVQEALQSCNCEPTEVIPLPYKLEIHKFKEIRKDVFYLIGVDTASEAGGTDFSTIEVFEYVTMDQVLEFRGKLAVKKFAEYVKLVAMMCPHNMIIVENTGIGNQVMEEIKYDEHYDFNLFATPRKTKPRRGQSQEMMWGLSTNPTTRPLITDALYHYVVAQPSMVKSERLALELLGLTDKVRRIEADTGGHDDLALALGFICYVRHYCKEVLGNVEHVDDQGATEIVEEAISFITEMNSPDNPLRHDYQHQDYHIFKKTLDRYIKKNLGTGLQGSIDIAGLFQKNPFFQ